MKHGLFVIAIVLFILLAGCSNSSLNQEDYVLFIRNPENGLKSCLFSKGANFCIQIEPAPYLALKELRGLEINEEKLNRELEKFSDYLYIDFSVEPGDENVQLLNKLDTVNFERNLNYLSFDLTDKISLVSQDDTLNCLMYQFVNNHGISSEYHFEMIFIKPINLNYNNQYSFQFKDEFLGFETLNIPLSLKVLSTLPTLKL